MIEGYCRCPGCGVCSANQKVPKLQDKVRRLQAEIEALRLYENMAKEYGLSVFEDLAALRKENEALRKALQSDALRFIQRVLESDAPRSDRDAATQMVRDMRMAARPEGEKT